MSAGNQNLNQKGNEMKPSTRTDYTSTRMWREAASFTEHWLQYQTEGDDPELDDAYYAVNHWMVVFADREKAKAEKAEAAKQPVAS